MKVIGYVRVSTEDQAREGVSLDAQKARIRGYCFVKEWELVSIEADKLSAKNMDRPGLQRCLQEIEAGDVEALVVYKLDRLTRSVVDLNTLVAMIDERGVALVSLQESLDATTPTGRLMMNLLGSVSQWEREIIAERTRDAMRYLKDHQKVRSRPGFGYDIKRGKFTPNAKEQAVIEQILAWREGGLSYQEIAVMLSKTGVPTKRGGQWAGRTVHKIATRA